MRSLVLNVSPDIRVAANHDPVSPIGMCHPALKREDVSLVGLRHVCQLILLNECLVCDSIVSAHRREICAV